MTGFFLPEFGAIAARTAASRLLATSGMGFTAAGRVGLLRRLGGGWDERAFQQGIDVAGNQRVGSVPTKEREVP